MPTQLIDALVLRTVSHPRTNRFEDCIGKYVGPINLIYHCWEAIGPARETFYSKVKDNIINHLDGLSASFSGEEFVVLSPYMVGRSKQSASPTVCFISQSYRSRKNAMTSIKESGIMKQYPDFKTAHMMKNPGWGCELEELGSGEALHTLVGPDPVKEVLYQPSEQLPSLGLPVFIRHSTGLRMATANRIRIKERIYYLMPSHVLFEKGGRQSLPSEKQEGSEFEMDGEESIDEDSEQMATFTSSGSYSSANESSESQILNDDLPESSASSSSYMNFDSANMGHVSIYPTKEPRGRARSEQLDEDEEPARSEDDHETTDLLVFGTVVAYSQETDWALVDRSGQQDEEQPGGAHNEELSISRITMPVAEETRVYTHTASRGLMTGTLAKAPSYIKLPRGATFQEVYTVRLASGLREGDCGSAVQESKIGRFLGHIVAGCRGSGFAYVMAASRIGPELERKVIETEGVAESDKNEAVADSVSSANSTGDKRPVTSRADMVKLIEISSRVQNLMKDLSHLPRPAQDLAQQHSAFHQSLLTLEQLSLEYGKPLTFSLMPFGTVLRECEAVIKRPTTQQAALTFKTPIKELWALGEIEQVRVRLDQQYRALEMCLSFMQLRLHLEMTKREQKLLNYDLRKAEATDIKGNTISELDHSQTSVQEALPSYVSHTLYKDWRTFRDWLSSDTPIDSSNPLQRPPSKDTGTPIDASPLLYQLRREVEDAILIHEKREKRDVEQKQEIRSSIRSDVQTTRTQETWTRQVERSSTNSLEHSHEGANSKANQSYFGNIDWSYDVSTHTQSEPRASASSTASTRTSLSSFSDSLFSLHTVDTSHSSQSMGNFQSPWSSSSSQPPKRTLLDLQLPPAALGFIVDSAESYSHVGQWRMVSKCVVNVQRGSYVDDIPKRRVVMENKQCNLHWRIREDLGMSIRAVYRSTRDARPKVWTMQHFPATGPSIPLSTTIDTETTITFPQKSYGKLDKGLTDIEYTFTDAAACRTFQTLLYTNNGKDEAAELVYEGAVRTISSDKHHPECRQNNVRLWRKTEGTLVVLFYTNALEKKGHWVEEPIHVFERISPISKRSNTLRLVFRRDMRKPKPFERIGSFTSHMLNKNTDIIPAKNFDIRSDTYSKSSTASTKWNPHGYSELSIEFQNSRDHEEFLKIWRVHERNILSDREQLKPGY